jgi:hypothetical protein
MRCKDVGSSDHWLVNTVGALVTANAVVLLAAAWSRRKTIDVAILGISAAMALAAIDVVYVFRGTISSIYFVDAAAEVMLLALGRSCCGEETLPPPKQLLSPRFHYMTGACPLTGIDLLRLS